MAMVCTDEQKQYGTGDIRRVLILADETPQTLPTTGEGVDRLADTAQLDTGSVLIDLEAQKKYVLFGTTWHEWNG